MAFYYDLGIRNCRAADVADISPFLVKLRVYVKILRKVQDVDAGGETMELIVSDYKGSKIQVTISSGFITEVTNSFQLGNWYAITGFQLAANNGICRPTNHEYRIIWDKHTTTHVYVPSNKYKHGLFFSFADFGSVKTGMCPADLCVDLLGRVLNVGNFVDRERSGSKRRHCNLYLQLVDKRNCVLNLRVPGNYDYDFLGSLKDYKGNIVICLVRFAKLEKQNGEWQATTFSAITEIVLDPVLREAIELRDDFNNIS